MKPEPERRARVPSAAAVGEAFERLADTPLTFGMRVIAMKKMLRYTLSILGYEINKRAGVGFKRGIPDANLYVPLFSPWRGHGEFERFHEHARPHTVVSADRCYVLYTLAKQAVNLGGEFWECGVYKGGTARLLAEVIATWSPSPEPVKLRLFDTFGGMPETDPRKDRHREGDFSDTSMASVKQRIGGEDHISFHQGLIPETFAGLEESEIAFSHIDVDIHKSIIDCCRFIYPRLMPGGFMIFDDYGFPTCPGARQAVDDFFRDKIERPLVLPTGQALVFAMGGERARCGRDPAATNLQGEM